MAQLQNTHADVITPKYSDVRPPANLSLTSVPSKQASCESDDVSLLEAMQGLSLITETASTTVVCEASKQRNCESDDALLEAMQGLSLETETTSTSSTTETTEDVQASEDSDYSDLWLIDFNSNQPSSGGLIGGSVVGIASKYLLDEQSALLKMSLNWLSWSAKNNEQQGNFAQSQRDSARDAAKDNFNAGMMQVAAGFSGAGCAGIAAAGGMGTAATKDSLATKESQMNDCDARMQMVNEAKPATTASAATGSRTEQALAQGKKNIVKSAFEDGDGVPKDKHYKTEADRIHKQQVDAATGTNKTALEANGGETNKAKIEADLRDGVKPLLNKEGALDVKGKATDIKAELELDDGEKAGIQEKTEKNKERLSNEYSSTQHKLASDMQQQNLIWKDAIGGILQSGFTLGKTIEEQKGSLSSANSQLYATLSSQMANLVGSASSMASNMYQQAMSTMQGTMDALRRAANPG